MRPVLKPEDGPSAVFVDGVAETPPSDEGPVTASPRRAAVQRSVGIGLEFVGILFVSGFVASFLVAFVRAARRIALHPDLALVLTSVLTTVFVSLLVLWRAKADFGGDWQRRMGFHRPSGMPWWWIAIIACAWLLAHVAWVVTFVALSGASIPLVPGATHHPVLQGVWIVLLAPLSEELLFRGFLDARLRSVAPGWLAFAITAALFAAIHYNGAWARPFSVAVLALALGWLRRATGSLWPPLLVHVVNNGLALVVLSAK